MSWNGSTMNNRHFDGAEAERIRRENGIEEEVTRRMRERQIEEEVNRRMMLASLPQEPPPQAHTTDHSYGPLKVQYDTRNLNLATAILERPNTTHPVSVRSKNSFINKMQGTVTVDQEEKSCTHGLRGASRSTMSLSSWSSDDSWQDALDLDDGGGLDWDLSGEEELHVGLEASSVVKKAQLSSRDADAIDHAGLPVFTPQDRLTEIGTLTCSELRDIASDLHGITTGVANLQVDGSNDDSRDTVLSRLEDELTKLPAEKTAAYRRAVIKCPGLVSDERRMAFLNREDGDPVLAAVRLALYWELRLKTFGPERCFLPMTLNGAMRGEVENMVRWPIHQLLPVNDTAGRAIWYNDISRRELDKYSIDQELMAVWYLLEVAMEDPQVLKGGFVYVANVKKAETKHIREKGQVEPPAERLVEICDRAMPMPVRALHLCHPNTLVYYLLPTVLYMFGTNIRHRLQLHRGSEAKIHKELEDFCLPVDRLPVELGGAIVLNMATFLADRMALESARSDPRRVMDQKPIAVATGPAPKRSRSDQNASPGETAPTAKPKGIADPRMNEAVKIRLANLDLSLQDVLLRAGYTFDFRNERGDPVDADNITLQQRKNNLCRRIRNHKKRQEAAAASPVEAQQQNQQDSTITPNAAFPPLGVELEIDSTNILPTSAQNRSEDSNDEIGSISGESLDSFYDAIVALPDSNEGWHDMFLTVDR